MKVRVKQTLQENFIGFADHARRRPGDVFTIPDEPRRELFPGEKKLLNSVEGKAEVAAVSDADGRIPQAFSFRWMEPVDPNVPESVTTAQQSMDRRSDIIKEEKAGQRALDAETQKADPSKQDVL